MTSRIGKCCCRLSEIGALEVIPASSTRPGLKVRMVKQVEEVGIETEARPLADLELLLIPKSTFTNFGPGREPRLTLESHQNPPWVSIAGFSKQSVDCPQEAPSKYWYVPFTFLLMMVSWDLPHLQIPGGPSGYRFDWRR